MATYLEIRTLINDEDLPNRLEVATVVCAENLISAVSPTAADKAWASLVFSNPKSEGRKVLMAVLAANKTFTVEQIKGASDADIQAQVDIIVPNLVDALAGV
jgi:hypothetical protein